MLALFTILAMTNATLTISPSAAENGVHVRTDTGTSIATTDGSDLHIGTMYPGEILDARVAATDNANTAFHVTLTVPHDNTLGPRATVLVSNEIGFAQMTSGTLGTGDERVRTMSFKVNGREHAEAIAQHLGTKPLLRQHPGYQLQVTFEATEGTSARMQIKNIGSSAFSFIYGGRNRGTRDNQFSFSATREGNSVPILTAHDFGGLAVIKTLEPGEVHEQDVDLSNWFELEPGDYQMLGSYLMNFTASASDSFDAVWVDYATAAFALRVE